MCSLILPFVFAYSKKPDFILTGRTIPKVLKMVPVATLLGAQHYKASTGFSSPNKYRTTNIATLTSGGRYGRLAVMLNTLSSLNIEIIIIIITMPTKLICHTEILLKIFSSIQ